MEAIRNVLCYLRERQSADRAARPLPVVGCCPNSVPGAARVGLLAGVCGALAGTLPRLQTAIESAQVLAGIVQYPPDNPFYLYHIKCWTLLHQVPALLLQCGLSERTLSLLLGALLGMLSFQALALCCYVIGRNALVALAFPFLAVASLMYEEVGNVYPIFLVTDRPWNCYGICGTSLALLAWTLAACGWVRLCALLMGIAPAIHPTMGGWCLALGLPVLLWHCRRDRAHFCGAVAAVGAGLCVTALSYALHLHHARSVPVIEPALRDRYIAAFIQGWDTHRQPVPLHEPALLYAVACAALCGLWLAIGDKADSARRMLCRVLLASAAASLVLAGLTHVQEHLPTVVLMAMPGRFVNVVCLALPALTIGFLALQQSVLSRLALLVVFALAVLRTVHRELDLVVPQVWHGVLFATVFAAAEMNLAGPQSSRLMRHLGCVALAGLAIFSAWELTRNFMTGATCCGMTVCRIVPLRWRKHLDRAALWSALWAALAAASLVGVWWLLGTMAAAALAGLFVLVVAAPRAWDWSRASSMPARQRAAWRLFGAACWTTLAIACVARVQWACARIVDWRSHSVYRAAQQGHGLLLTASSLRGIQLKTSRPVLLEGAALNQLPYVPESGPRMNYILQRIYGEDLFAPRPKGWKLERGGLMDESGREVWERRTPEEWRALAQEFQFTQVLAFSEWNLQLPVLARTKRVTLYDLPDAAYPAGAENRNAAPHTARHGAKMPVARLPDHDSD